MKDILKQLTKGSSRQGSYAVGVSAIVIAIIIILNLIVGELPSKFIQFDMTDSRIFTISDLSKDYLAKLDKQVDILVVAEPDRVDERIRKFLDKYDALSDRITVSEIDPVLNPSVLKTYDVSAETVVVKCEETGKVTSVPFSDIIVADVFSYYTTGRYTETEFDAEGQITSAVDYVVRESTSKVYTLEGHGESTLPPSVTDLIDKANLLRESLNLLTKGGVPEDCDVLIAYAPVKDLANDELKMIKDYLAGGGKFLLLIDEDELPNFESLMAEYGMEMVEGYIADASRSYQTPFNLLPNIEEAGDLSLDLDRDAMALIINAKGMTIGKAARDTITTESFLTTSENGYAVTSDNNVQGTYSLGATAVEKIGDEEKASRFTVITASSLIDSSITDAFANVANLDIFMGIVTTDLENVSDISIPPKSLETGRNTVKNAGLWSILLIFVIPIILLVGGFVYWLKRRKL